MTQPRKRVGTLALCLALTIACEDETAGNLERPGDPIDPTWAEGPHSEPVEDDTAPPTTASTDTEPPPPPEETSEPPCEPGTFAWGRTFNSEHLWAGNWTGSVLSLALDEAHDRLLAAGRVVGHSSAPKLLEYAKDGSLLWTEEAFLAAPLADGGLITVSDVGDNRLTRWSSSGDVEWTTPVEGSSNALGVLPDGSIVVLGSMIMTLPEAGYGSIAVLTRVAPDGEELWHAAYAGLLDDTESLFTPRALAVSPEGDLYFSGYARLQHTERGEIVKVDGTGEEQWRFTLPESYGKSTLTGLETTEDGGLLAVGTVNTGHASPSIYHVELDAQGVVRWVDDAYLSSSYGADIAVSGDRAYSIGTHQSRLLVTAHCR